MSILEYIKVFYSRQLRDFSLAHLLMPHLRNWPTLSDFMPAVVSRTVVKVHGNDRQVLP